MGEPIWRTIVICPNCGEDNADSFRFCGMCGSVLEARRDARRPVVVPADPLEAFPPPLPSLSPKISTPEPQRPFMVETATATAGRQVPPISGPSMLGLDQPIAGQAVANQPSRTSPSIDSLREKSFSGLDSFLEHEPPKTGGRRILMMIVLLAALGAAGWWTYTNYLGISDGKKPASPPSSVAVNSPAEKPAAPATSQAPEAHPMPDSGPATAPPSASTTVAEHPTQNANPGPDTSQKAADTETRTTAEAKSAAKSVIPEPPVPAPAETAPASRSAMKREPRIPTAKPSIVPATTSTDAGDAAFRKGEAYLYGRGMPQNCDEAVKNLKAASAKSNAKARSTFGTMYATGHCVPRDLPTSYLWFALALRIDPNNQILEKDLSAIWNQMTPPERQMATRMKE